MTKLETYNFVTALLDGFEMDQNLFDSFLDVAQMYWEGQRPWMVLRTEDTSQTISAGNTYETEKSLPADFRKWYTRHPIVLTDAQGNIVIRLKEIPIASKNSYKSNNSRFYCNYRTKKFYVCGAPGQSCTARLYYIKKGILVSADDGNEWEFDEEYHKILGFSVAVYYKLGVDYDIINNSQADSNATVAGQMFNVMTDWDAELQESEIDGLDYGYGEASGPNLQHGGNIV